MSLFFFYLIARRPARSALFPTRRSSDLGAALGSHGSGWFRLPAGFAAGRAFGRNGRTRRRPFAIFVTRLTLVGDENRDRKSTRLNSSHTVISYAVFCLKKKNDTEIIRWY